MQKINIQRNGGHYRLFISFYIFEFNLQLKKPLEMEYILERVHRQMLIVQQKRLTLFSKYNYN